MAAAAVVVVLVVLVVLVVPVTGAARQTMQFRISPTTGNADYANSLKTVLRPMATSIKAEDVKSAPPNNQQLVHDQLAIKPSGSSGSSCRSKRVSVNADGKEINTKHEQFDLSVAMMLGIRFSVSKTSHEEKQRRAENFLDGKFTNEDFQKIDKSIFPYTPDIVTMNDPFEVMHQELFDVFKFRSYAPLVFSRIRRLFGVNRTDFVESLCGNAHFIEFLSNSNSGVFFFYSHDGKYLIKTQTYQEISSLRKILPKYYQYLIQNPTTFIGHYYGIFQIKIPHLGKNVPFVVMKSVFDSENRIQKIWDLKGSKLGRRAKEGEAVFKDLDFLEQGAKFDVGPKKKSLIVEQLKKDASFLAELNMMDYSLLVGVHQRSVERENGVNCLPYPSEKKVTPNLDNLRGFASLFLQEATGGEYIEEAFPGGDSDDASSGEVEYIGCCSGLSSDTSFEKLKYRDSCNDLEGLHIGNECLSIVDCDMNVVEIAEALDDRVEVMWVTSSRRISNRDDCGVDSWVVDMNSLLSKEIYYIGIIDILQRYNTRKYVEHTYKATYLDENEISCVDPNFYAQRFINFCIDAFE